MVEYCTRMKSPSQYYCDESDCWVIYHRPVNMCTPCDLPHTSTLKLKQSLSLCAAKYPPPTHPPTQTRRVPSDLHHHHLFLNREGRCGTTDDFTNQFPQFFHFPCSPLPSEAWRTPDTRPIHSVMLSSHRFLRWPSDSVTQSATVSIVMPALLHLV